MRVLTFEQLVIAGGETSGAILQALGVRYLQFVKPIEGDVAWMLGGRVNEPSLLVALKPGNFGGPDFMMSAWQSLDQAGP